MKIYNLKDIIFEIEPSQIFELLQQLTEAPLLNPEQLYRIVSELPVNHNIFVILNEQKKLVGMTSIIIESKLIHGGKQVGHIEDLVVDSKYRGLGIGKRLIEFCKTYAKQKKCYKVILDCADETRKFYEKNGFTHKNCGMSLYF
jgi:glucosamine-phosphate N-acetyltransferase|tara:strand:+ start:1387 stop:1818 length:432 start_codon:yes stop_codon:yes gene_type:complete